MRDSIQSQGQSRKSKAIFLSIVVFLVITYLTASFFGNLFGDAPDDEAISTFSILKMIVPYTLSFSFVLFNILKFLFVRESKKILPEGFYTPTSWLDITHDSLVVIDKRDLVVTEIEESHVASVQNAFQNGASLDDLSQLSNTKKQMRLPFNEIHSLTSEHNTDYIVLEQGEDSHTINFMTPLVKAHALGSIQQQLPKTLSYDKHKKTRLQAMLPWLIFTSILGAIGFFVDNFTVRLLLAAFSLFIIMPNILKALFDPPIVESWKKNEGD